MSTVVDPNGIPLPYVYKSSLKAIDDSTSPTTGNLGGIVKVFLIRFRQSLAKLVPSESHTLLPCKKLKIIVILPGGQA